MGGGGGRGAILNLNRSTGNCCCLSQLEKAPSETQSSDRIFPGMHIAGEGERGWGGGGWGEQQTPPPKWFPMAFYKILLQIYRKWHFTVSMLVIFQLAQTNIKYYQVISKHVSESFL